MRRFTWIALLVWLVAGVTATEAATQPSSITRNSLTHARDLDRLSVGVDFEAFRRIMQHGGVDFELWGNSYSGYLGYDLFPAVTVFATLGSVRAKINDISDYGSLQPKWSVGAGSRLWHYDVNSPTFMTGRLTIRAAVELSHFNSDFDGHGDIEWYDVSVALPVGYEIPEDSLNLRPDKAVSLNLWVGPLVSWVDGEYDRAGLMTDFDGERVFGGAGGVDMYFAPNVCLSAQAALFEKVSVSAAARYHF